MPRTPLCAAALVAVVLSTTAAGPAARADGPDDFFERRVRPVLVGQCLGCHGPKSAKAGLRLDSRAGLLRGADSGPVVTPGDPADSPLVEAVRRSGAVKMPPKTALDPGV